MIGTWLVAAAVLAGMMAMAGCTRNVDESDIVYISNAELAGEMRKMKAGQLLILDPRRSEAYAAGHIEGAENVELPDIDPRGGQRRFKTPKLIVVYGDTVADGLARAVTKRLLSAGYRKVRLLDPGFNAWRAQGRPVATSSG